MSSSSNIFIVEDDPVYARMVKYVAELNPEHEVHLFESGKECLNNLHLNPTIISLDYTLTDTTGEEILEKIQSYNPKIGVIILSGQKDINIAVKLLKLGAYDYIVKDDQTKERLFHAFEKLKKNQSLQYELEILREELSEKYDFDQGKLVGNSKAMQHVIRLIRKAINSNITVSIQGETGTGKEVVARTIHFNSRRKTGKFVAVNVSAIPKDLLESELFGYEKGAFTGANSRKIGQFELANQGTLFLDEIGEMDIRLQAKLLRAIQEREILRVGGENPISFDTRIIVATHRDLGKAVRDGIFREDLYYRLLGLPIDLPPWRDRGHDLFILMNQFLSEFSSSNSQAKLTVSPEAKEKLLHYPFPGNVRELKAIIDLAAVVCEDGIIRDQDIIFNNPRSGVSFFNNEKTLREHNLDIINYYLKKYSNDVRQVANKLNIGKSTIYRLLKSSPKSS